MEKNFQKIPCVLIVDDDLNLLELLTQILLINNISADQASNGQIAFKMIQEKEYDLVISDIRMPVMTGTDLLKHIRNYQKDKRLKVFLMSAYSSGEILEDADALGADGFFDKPFDINFFLEKIMEELHILPQ